jgi:Ternary complex associated domain 9
LEELKGGFTGQILSVQATKKTGDAPHLPSIVKLAPAWLIRQEVDAYRSLVENKLANVVILKPETAFTREGDQGGLHYQLAGEGQFNFKTLQAYLGQADLEAINQAFNRLFTSLRPAWRVSPGSKTCPKAESSYMWLLPETLRVQYLPLPDDVNPPAWSLNRLPLSPQVQPGDWLNVQTGFIKILTKPHRASLKRHLEFEMLIFILINPKLTQAKFGSVRVNYVITKVTS